MDIKTFSKEVMAVTPPMHASFIRNLPAELKENKINISQMIILEMLRKNKECRMSDLSASLGVTKSAITAVTDRLIKMRFVKRLRSLEDRRVVRARLTPRGARLADKIRNYQMRIISRLFSNISQRERAQYVAILVKVKKKLESGTG